MQCPVKSFVTVLLLHPRRISSTSSKVLPRVSICSSMGLLIYCTVYKMHELANSLMLDDWRAEKLFGEPRVKPAPEIGSCFDATVLRHTPARARGGRRSSDGKGTDKDAPSTSKPDPLHFLIAGEGRFIKAGTRKRVRAQPKAPKAGALLPRKNPPNTAFRRFYERGDLPLRVDHHTSGNQTRWDVDLDTVDFHHYLPIFFDGIREKQEPHRFLAVQGTVDLLDAAGERALPCIPQLIVPLKTALDTRDPQVIRIGLTILQKLVMSSEQAGQALIPYYRQLLPVCSLFWGSGTRGSRKGEFDYSQGSASSLGELIAKTLALLEQRGGINAFINIKYMCPAYESVQSR